MRWSQRTTARSTASPGDGILIFFNDPLPVPEPGGARRRWRSRCRRASRHCATRWPKLGYDLDLGIGIAQGYATLGAFGFEGRWDYSAIGSVVNLAARLCDEAQGGQILIDRRTRAALDDAAEVAPVGPLSLKGFAQPVDAFRAERPDCRPDESIGRRGSDRCSRVAPRPSCACRSGPSAAPV